MDDGFILLYSKDGVVYPIAMSEDEYEMLQLIAPSIFKNKKMTLVDQPQGEAINLTEGTH